MVNNYTGLLFCSNQIINKEVMTIKTRCSHHPIMPAVVPAQSGLVQWLIEPG
jgi:hypothetical protein